jgi:AcrR family transcriptional regulator
VDPADPPYVRIADDLRRRITAGELEPGDRVPSTRLLMREWGVALATATKALTTLREQGLVLAVPRVGTVVAPRAEATPPPPADTPAPRRSRPPRRTGPPLARDRIVATAVAIADRDGLDALSMRGVAGELGVPTMSLYGHVRSKDDLVLLMIDSSFGEEPFPAQPPPGWRACLELSARLQWASYRRHPWLPQVISLTRPQALTNLFRLAEWSFAALEDHGLDQTELFDVHLTLCTYVRGVAIGIAPEAEAEADTGMSGDDWVETVDDVNEMIATGPFPALRRVGARGNYTLDLDRLFEFGLRRLLDGLTGLVEPA